MKSGADAKPKSVLETLNFRGAATQKVKTFILEEAQRVGKTEPWRLPSMRKLADHLGVSVATVQIAYRQLGKEGVICTDPNRASYVAPPKQQGKNRVFHIGIDFIKGDEDPNCSWRGSIYGGMLTQALSEGNRIIFHQIPSSLTRREDLLAADLSYSLDGVLLAMQANLSVWEGLEPGIPAVFCGMSSASSTKGFVAADLFSAALKIGEAFGASGRRRVYMAMHQDLAKSPESTRAFSGLAAGFMAGQSNSCIHFLAFGREEDELEMVRRLFKGPKHERPDAFFCPSDYTAMRLLKYLWALDIKVPEEVSVIGGTGLVLMNTEFFTMSRIFQPLAEMGTELVRRLIATLENQETASSASGVFLPCSFGGGATTLPEENAVIGIKN